MYAGNYAFPNNGAPPPAPQNPMQPGHGQGPPNQNPMYNPQQYPMVSQPGAGFPGAAPGMMPGAGPAGMMHNTGMPHMAAANGPMPNYQTPYTTSPYGAGIPSSVAPQMNVPPNYAMGGGMPMPGFPMHSGMNPQQQMMQQRMQQQPHQPHQPHQQHQPNPPPGMSTPTPQRTYQSQAPQSTPTPSHAPPPYQTQASTPQNVHGTPQQNQTPNNAQQQQHPPQPQPQSQPPPNNNIQTPQTPTFPTSIQGNGPNGTSSSSTPMSPGPDPRDKERVGLVLDINNELLVEAMQIQSTQQILKKERATTNGSDGAANESEKKPTKEEDLLAQDYFHCMRRLQSNLQYLAALADKKGSVTAAPCPAYLKAPPLNTSIKLRVAPGPDGSESKEPSNRDETARIVQDLYKKLQALYPGIDPNKEPTFPIPPARQGTQTADGTPGMTKPGAQTPGQPSPDAGKQRTPKMATSGPPQPNNALAGS
ncbi:hypothetical protein F5B20DRAFT_421658 [Whalleya microplaca]|nr:hypothetical protein F5B20DRAFT_421658 [Whalleya microplaca]